MALSVEQAARVPPRLTWEQAAAIPIVSVTAYEILWLYGGLKSGETLLVAGAASGVGIVCVQAGKYLGATVIGVSRSAEKLDKLRSLGLDAGIQAPGRGFSDRLLQATDGKGVHLAANLIGGGAFPDCLRSLANQGRLAIVGYVDGNLKAEVDLEAVSSKRLHIFGLSNQLLSFAQRAEAMRRFTRDLLPAFAEGHITPLVDRVFSFEELPAAKTYVESNAQFGKVVVRMP